MRREIGGTVHVTLRVDLHLLVSSNNTFILREILYEYFKRFLARKSNRFVKIDVVRGPLVACREDVDVVNTFRLGLPKVEKLSEPKFLDLNCDFFGTEYFNIPSRIIYSNLYQSWMRLKLLVPLSSVLFLLYITHFLIKVDRYNR